MAFDDPSDNTGKLTADAKRLKDYADLSDEMSGRNTGRIKRFLGEGHGAASAVNERKQREERQMSALQAMLLSDPEYAKLYDDTWDLLRRAEKLAETLLTKAEAELQHMLNNAARLSDGKALFMDADGQIRTEDGKVVDPAEAEGVNFPDGAPSYEDYRDKRDAIDKIREYQVDVLGHAREQLEDEDDPLGNDELEDLNKDIQSGLDEINLQNQGQSVAENPTHGLSSNIGLPKLGG